MARNECALSGWSTAVRSVLQNHYQHIVEIGTSTGHSTVWLAWAASQTGGKVVTLELNERRQKEAIRNVEEAGLTAFVEFRLGNAHELVKTLGFRPDFVFSDADKDWYLQYFLDLRESLLPGGCYTTHNVTDGQAGDKYIDYLQHDPDFTSRIERSSRAGVMVSFKKK
ncbi:MAG: class I SAM-dependent methyltransferase [Cyclobacteriaceae bacterium]|nr:class I SAM-dependent methyltransferase [Cyclobacteriaceae bacterium]